MSVIRQRSKNLIFSGLIGFISGLIVVLCVYMIGIRGNIKVIEWILNDSQLEVMTMSEPIEEPVIMKEKVIVLNKSLQKDTIITKEWLEYSEVEPMYIPLNSSKDMDELIGKKALIDIEPSTIMTNAMTEEVNVYPVSFETLEIQNVHYPDILAIGQSINMRIHYPTGQDYTIIENKSVIHIDVENKSFFVNLTEEEILSYSSAIEDKNIYPGTQLYITIEGNGSIALEGQSDSVTNAYKNGLIYRIYPLNPNVLALSQIKNFDATLLNDRVVLDQSLKEFFDLNSERFSYNIELKEESSQGLINESSNDDIGIELEDESIALQSPVNTNEVSNIVVNNQDNNISNESEKTDYVEEENLTESDSDSVDQEADFDF